MIAASPVRGMYILIRFYIYMYLAIFALRANPIYTFGGGDFGTH